MSVTLAQLDAALTQLTGVDTTLVAEVAQLSTDVNALIAAVQAGQNFSNELNEVNADITAIQNATTSLQTTDTSVTTETGDLGQKPASPPAS